MDASASALDPIILNTWPSCNECLSWSSDGELAVAGGEFVHILTPKHASKAGSQSDPNVIGLRDWHSNRIRINVFRQREWPDQNAAHSESFSLGEEQSLSTVIALAWAPPGIGPHRRSVLAVLTSNLVLSLWQSNGTVGEWHRVVVVNHALGGHFGWVNEAGKDIHRAKRRIRAFDWAPPCHSVKAEDGRVLRSKWGVFHLAVANDEEVITIVRVSKEKRKGQMAWNVGAICNIGLPAAPTNGSTPHAGSLFQRAMTRKFPIMELSWTGLEEESESFIAISRRNYRNFIGVRARLLPPDGDSISTLEHHLRLDANLLEEPLQSNLANDPQIVQASGNVELKKKMEEARIEFDSLHNLEGNSVTREWGFASRPTHDAACITSHPSDMVEYTTASMEKCTLLFVRKSMLANGAQSSGITMSSPSEVLSAVIGWILGVARDIVPALPIDRYLLGIAASYASELDDEVMKRKAGLAFSRLRETSESQLDQDEMEVDEPSSIDSLAGSDIETCLICEALIPFHPENPSIARCESGHPYSKLRHLKMVYRGC
jgi:Transcription factor IIIC subunit delta N-term